MNDQDHDNDIDPELQTIATPDRSFSGSEGHTFLGEPLKAFSVRRQIAAQHLGNKLLSGRARLEMLPCQCGGNPECEICKGSGERTGAYDGMFTDIATLVYLCRCRESEVMRATRQPEKVAEDALLWAESVGMAAGSSVFLEASTIYGELMGELFQAQFQVTKTAGGSNSSKNG